MHALSLPGVDRGALARAVRPGGRRPRWRRPPTRRRPSRCASNTRRTTPRRAAAPSSPRASPRPHPAATRDCGIHARSPRRSPARPRLPGGPVHRAGRGRPAGGGACSIRSPATWCSTSAPRPAPRRRPSPSASRDAGASSPWTDIRGRLRLVARRHAPAGARRGPHPRAGRFAAAHRPAPRLGRRALRRAGPARPHPALRPRPGGRALHGPRHAPPQPGRALAPAPQAHPRSSPGSSSRS